MPTQHDEQAPDWTPQGDAEQYASARAVYEARKRGERLQVFESLSTRERFLIEIAYDAGVDAMKVALASTLGPASVTVDANAVRQASVLGLDAVAPWPDIWHPDNRVLSIAERADRLATDWAERTEALPEA